MGLESYRELRVWQRGMDLAEACYTLTSAFPPEERFGMMSQIRRAAAAIPANIAEGYGRGSRPDYIRFVRIANGSLKELETHLLLALRIKLVDEARIAPVPPLADELGAMLHRLMGALRARSGAAAP
ncbi:MAG: four helix bundle protein [Phycisphaerales bacterium]|nr:four helix bundle protein [Phycisphaerales bacterium]